MSEITSIRYLQFIINEAEETLGYAISKHPEYKNAFADTHNANDLKKVFETLNDLNERIAEKL